MGSNLAVFVGTKGRGSNMANLVRAGRQGNYPGHVALVISPSEEAPAVEVARALGVKVEVIPRKTEDFENQILVALATHKIDLICLAGIMFLMPAQVLTAYPDRILNIHPALLPKFGGKGMFGIHVHEAVIAAGETQSGATVHFVNERYDEGQIVMQMTCPVDPGMTPEKLAARVLEVEHELYPTAVAKVLNA